jgi:hypothetical protein
LKVFVLDTNKRPQDPVHPAEAKPRHKQVRGFQTGDIVKAVVTKGKKIGTYTGRVAVRTSGFFNIKTETETVQGISWKYCRPIHCMDAYNYNYQKEMAILPLS